MQVRSPGIPDEPSGESADESLDDTFADDDPHPLVAVARSTGAVAFAVPRHVIIAKLAAAVIVGLASAAADNQPQLVVGLLAAAGLASYGLRDVLARQRLGADADGVVAVRGYAGRRHLPWADIERVRVDARSRFGGRSELLEIDAGEEIFLFSRFDLGVDPDQAAQALAAVRRPDPPS